MKKKLSLLIAFLVILLLLVYPTFAQPNCQHSNSSNCSESTEEAQATNSHGQNADDPDDPCHTDGTNCGHNDDGSEESGEGDEDGNGNPNCHDNNGAQHGEVDLCPTATQAPQETQEVEPSQVVPSQEPTDVVQPTQDENDTKKVSF